MENILISTTWESEVSNRQIPEVHRPAIPDNSQSFKLGERLSQKVKWKMIEKDDYYQPLAPMHTKDC